jgi:DNA processing protein
MHEGVPSPLAGPFSADELLGPLNDVERRYAPRTLYLAGHRDLLHAGPRVAVIGSRRASAAGLASARKLAEVLVARGIVVVSGLAEGIDTAAHEAAIRAGGRTIAVLGTPLDTCYPTRNRALQERIAREHLLLSQFPPGMPTVRGNFPLRNRTMALLAHASIIVEASDTSGSLHQGWEALRLGRLLITLPAVSNDPALTWPKKMAEYGALTVAIEHLDEVLDVLPSPSAELGLDAAL